MAASDRIEQAERTIIQLLFAANHGGFGNA